MDVEKEYYKIYNSITNPFKIKDYNKIKNYQSEYNFNEKKVLNGLNNIANKVEKYRVNDSHFFNKSIRDIMKNTANTMINIIDEISNILKKNIKSTIWWKPYIIKLKHILLVFTKKDRLIYTGIIFIFLSIILNFIDTSS